MTPHSRFALLIEDFLDLSDAEPPPVSGDEHLLDFGARTFHLALAPGSAEVRIATAVYFGGAPGEIGPDLIADFNAYHLFHGGYRLAADPATASLYVSVRKSLARLEASGLDAFFEDFIARCISCTRWCVDEALGVFDAEPAEAARAV